MAWYDDLLSRMGAPDSEPSKISLQLWAQSEGVPDSWNNWLATTEPCCGCVQVNSAGVCQYPSESAGVTAIYNTLQGSAYLAVVDAFVSNAGASQIWDAVNGSPWCSGCQNGHYPVALYNYLGGHGAPPPSPGGGGQPTIRLGSRGRAVRLLQRRLDRLGHKLPVNGIFDRHVEDTVKEFQRTHHLTVDGIVGPATWGRLFAATGGTGGTEHTHGPGPVAPKEPPGRIDPSVREGWGRVAKTYGQHLAGQIHNLEGYTTNVVRDRK